MKHIKLFESFSGNSENFYVYIANPGAKKAFSTSPIFKRSRLVEGENVANSERIVKFLESKNFTAPHDFIAISEAAGDVKSLGVKDGVIYFDVKGHKYGREQKEGDLDLIEIARKFEKMLQFSSFNALRWLEKHTKSKFGAKGQEQADDKLAESAETKNYMFFQNLKTIKEAAEKMLAIDPAKVDELLNDHNWATDHIATSKDDIEEVCGFLCGSGVAEGKIQDFFTNKDDAGNTKFDKLKMAKELPGKRIKLVKMGEDDPNPVPPGTEGTIESVDDTGTIHVKWDNGRTLGVVPNVDKYTILEK